MLALQERLRGLGAAAELRELPSPFAQARAFPAADGDSVLGHAVLLFDEPPTESAAEASTYLARHLALALRNLGRFAEVEDLAYLDDLTRLYNARYLDEALERELHGKGPFSLLFLDLDHFKSVNDTHGHLVGSKLLVEAARVVKSCTRDQDVVARWGGDEYVVMLRSTTSRSRTQPFTTRPASTITLLPTRWPWVSFTVLNRSRSRKSRLNTAPGPACSAATSSCSSTMCR